MVMSSRVAARPATSGPTRPELIWLFVVAAIVFIVALLLPHEPDRLDVTMENPSDYLLYVSASSPADDTLTPVAIISPRTSVEITGVLDRGADWVLHISAAGRDAGSVAVDRADLVDGAYAIPSAIGDRLADEGVVSDIELAPNRGR